MSVKIVATRKPRTGVNRFDLVDNVFSFAIGVMIMFSIFLIFILDKSCFQIQLEKVEITEEAIPVIIETTQIQEDIIEIKENEKNAGYTEEDVELLARLMYAEEGVLLQRQSMENAELAHKLCGSVVLHRTKRNYLGASTIKETIYAKGQYADTTLQKLDVQEAPEIVKQWAEELLSEGSIGPENMIYQSEFPQGEVYIQIDNQYFGCCQ